MGGAGPAEERHLRPPHAPTAASLHNSLHTKSPTILSSFSNFSVAIVPAQGPARQRTRFSRPLPQLSLRDSRSRIPHHGFSCIAESTLAFRFLL